ncbi:MAG: right-handed parallel beta-helix repeat-containing protein [Candidatus Hodarchaeota archaeon]
MRKLTIIVLVWLLGMVFASNFSVNACLLTHPRFCDPLSVSLENSVIEKKGTLTHNETWGGEILITETVIVPEGITLTIEAGAVIKFKHNRGYKEGSEKLRMIISGTLKAVGTPNNQIWFTSDAKDALNGDWCMIRFINAEKNSTIKYAIIEFAQQGINLWNSSPTISHSIVRWNNWEGIYLESYCEPLIEYSLIYENGYNGIAMEQFNNATLQYNTIWRSGTHGVHIDASTARVEYNIVKENDAGLSVDDHGTLIALNNTLRANRAGIQCGEGSNTVIAHGNKFENNDVKIVYSPSDSVENIEGNGAGKIVYDYPDNRPYELGYIPGDPEKDRYMYVYPDEDETRRVINKIGEGLGLTWSVTWDGEYIWTAALWGDVYKLDPETGEIKVHWMFPGPQAWGMTYDGENLWINDFAEKKIYEMDKNGTVLSSFASPDTEGGAKGITWDGECLYLMGWTTPTIYKLNKSGSLIDKIEIKDGWVGGGLTWDGNYFWAPGGKGICKIDKDGRIVGGIYAASEGTFDLAWDGQYLWATQRTNENWQDAKIYQIEILISSNYPIEWNKETYHISILSNSAVSDFNFNGTEMQISFDVTGKSGANGFCNVTIPKSLLKGTPWAIKVDDTPITDFDEKTNDTYTFLYFTYTHKSPLQVTIEGTWVPTQTSAVSTWTSTVSTSTSLSVTPDSLFFLLIMLAVATAIYKRRRPKTPIH